MKVRINIGKEINLGFHIPEGMEYDLLCRIAQDVRSLDWSKNWTESLKGQEETYEILKNPGAFADAEETITKEYPESEKTTPQEDVLREEQYGKYRGFLYIKCRYCGKERAFNAKKPLTGFRCECGQITELEDLKLMYVRCECGRK